MQIKIKITKIIMDITMGSIKSEIESDECIVDPSNPSSEDNNRPRAENGIYSQPMQLRN